MTEERLRTEAAFMQAAMEKLCVHLLLYMSGCCRCQVVVDVILPRTYRMLVVVYDSLHMTHYKTGAITSHCSTVPTPWAAIEVAVKFEGRNNLVWYVIYAYLMT